MGRDNGGSDSHPSIEGPDQDDEMPEHPAYVSPFFLDTFEVTVGRFRNFVEAYPGSIPAEGTGAHPAIPGSGWSKVFEQQLPKTREALQYQLTQDNGIGLNYVVWSPAPGDREHYPMNKVTWFVAFAFCVWDGGRLPTEAEWEFAAAGGEENRFFPWGAYHTSWWKLRVCLGWDCIGQGRAVLGYGRWGHLDLAGSRWEWVLDGYAPYSGAPCIDCAVPFQGSAAVRGGGMAGPPTYWWDSRAAARASWGSDAFLSGGFRCARSL